MLTIYNREIESGTATFDMSPRSLQDQVEWVAEHSGAHPAVVALITDDMGDEVVVGFGSLSPYRPRAAYSTTVEDSVYVAEGAQRLGIGGILRFMERKRLIRRVRELDRRLVSEVI
jgi:phosphinothricin acetyltransferase